MLTLSRQLVCLVVLATGACSAPSGSSTSSLSSSPTETSSASTSVPRETRTVSPASTASNAAAYMPDADVTPMPTRGTLGANILGPMNIPLAQQNPDVIAPPTTDHGDVPNAKWPFALSHQRLKSGGWARQKNIHQMPIATQMAGVDMRLKAGAIRELHWHKTAEWAFVLKGSTQISSVDENGRNYLATVGPGDLWYFPPGIPHSLQATASKYTLIDHLLRPGNTARIRPSCSQIGYPMCPKKSSRRIFSYRNRHSTRYPVMSSIYSPETPQIPMHLLLRILKNLNRGTVKIVDSTRFPISKTIAVAEYTVEPGAMRELHWHPTQDEWSFFLEGNARITVFAAESTARTFDYQAGDIGYVPAAMGHYVENIGNGTLHYLEMFKTDKYSDISLQEWLANTPPALVKAHLGLPEEVIAGLVKTKQYVVGPSA